MTAQPLCVSCRRRPVEAAWRPFCSERCQLEDLARWLEGVYRVPGERAAPTSPDPDADPDSSSDKS